MELVALGAPFLGVQQEQPWLLTPRGFLSFQHQPELGTPNGHPWVQCQADGAVCHLYFSHGA